MTLIIQIKISFLLLLLILASLMSLKMTHLQEEDYLVVEAIARIRTMTLFKLTILDPFLDKIHGVIEDLEMIEKTTNRIKRHLSIGLGLKTEDGAHSLALTDSE